MPQINQKTDRANIQAVDATYAIPRASSSKPESSRAALTLDATTNGNGATANGDVEMDGNDKVEEVEGEAEKRVGWVIGEGLNEARSEQGWEEKYEQRWPFRASSGAEDWDGRAYVMYVLATPLNTIMS